MNIRALVVSGPQVQQTNRDRRWQEYGFIGAISACAIGTPQL